MKIALTGDSILQRRLNSREDATLRPLFDLIRAADVSFTNLEVLPNDFEGDPALESGGSHFGAPSWILDELVAGGFDLFSTANNHALDYGIAGLHAMHRELDKRELLYTGTGRNLEEARRPVYCTRPEGTVALLACSATFGKGQESSSPLCTASPRYEPFDQITSCSAVCTQTGCGVSPTVARSRSSSLAVARWVRGSTAAL